jgi:alpha-L-rhamnosidase
MKQIVFVFLLLAAVVSSAFAGVVIENLKVNQQEKPLGTDISVPHFSWQMKALDAKRGYAQKAYQIVVTGTNNQVVWDSKK